MDSLTIGDIAGLSGCVFIVLLLAFIHHMSMKLMNPVENQDDYLAIMFVWVARGGIVIFTFVPCAFFANLYLIANPHVLDFLIFTKNV